MIRHYLLGLSTEDECEQIEAHLFADDEFFGQIKAAEDQLIDEYLTGLLPVPIREQFEREYLRIPERRKKVEMAGDLLRLTLARKTIEAAPTATRNPEAPDALGQTQQSSTVVPFPSRKFSPGNRKQLAVAALLVITIGSGWGLWKITHLQSQLEEAQTTQERETKRATDLEHQLAQERGTAAELAKRLEAERQHRSQLEQALLNSLPSPPQTSSPSPAPAGLLSCILFPNLTRSSGGARPLRLTPSVNTIQFQLMLQAHQPDSSLTVLIRTAEGTEVWHQENIRARQARGQKLINLKLPATTFEPADYVIEVRQKSSDQGFEKVATYHFAVRN
ncbi:MAG: hypothetical protein HY774_28595 [Acidobacteria bacterium]|nr:hypothetical protein [Acidobacteriota bacterium]